MLRLTLGPLPAGVAAHVLDFAETEVLFSARGLSRHFKAACDGACGLPRLRQLLARARHLVEVTPHWRPDSAEAGLFHSHFEGNGLAFCHKSVALLGALSQLRALENLQRAHFQWHCIDTPQKVDRYLDAARGPMRAEDAKKGLREAAKLGQAEVAAGLLTGCVQRKVQLDQAAWTAGLSACKKAAAWQTASLILSQDVRFDVVSLGAAISCFGAASQWQRAIATLQRIQTNQLQSSVISFNAAITACEKGSQWLVAAQVLQGIKEQHLLPDCISYSGMISACQKNSLWDQAIDCLQLMRSAAVPPDRIALNSAMSACAKAGLWENAISLLGEMEQDDLQPDLITCSALTTACEKASKWDLALATVQMMPSLNLQPSTVTCSSLISACGRGGQWPLALSVLHGMMESSISLNQVSLGAAITACSLGNEWQRCLALLQGMPSWRLKSNEVTYNSAITALETSQRWDIACYLLGQMGGTCSRTSYHALMSVLGAASCWQRAVLLLPRAEASPGEASPWAAAIAACGSGEQWAFAVFLLKQMPKVGRLGGGFQAGMAACQDRWQLVLQILDMVAVDGTWSPDAGHFQTAITACSSQWEWVLHLLAKASDSGTSLGVAAFQRALAAFRVAGVWQIALGCLTCCPKPDASILATLVATMGDVSQWQVALTLLQHENCDGAAANAAITACERASAWSEALKIFWDMPRLRLQRDATSLGAAVGASPWPLALELLDFAENDDSLRPTAESYNAAINACSSEGLWQASLSLLVGMERAEIRPDDITCGAVVSSCEPEGQWDLALHLLWRQSEFSSTQCFDIMNRLLVNCTKWEHSLSLFASMLKQRLLANGMHAASTCSLLQKTSPQKAAEFLDDCLDLWKSEDHEILRYDLLALQRPQAGCNVRVLAARPGMVAVSKPPQRTTKAVIDHLGDCMRVSQLRYSEEGSALSNANVSKRARDRPGDSERFFRTFSLV
ncbi:unnamed protein product [Effrenium voratum]|nr:unnamed protein product [Effrenium voratum]